MDDRLLESFEINDLRLRTRRDQSIVTTLVLSVGDQAEFHELLNTLYDWHLPVRTVKLVSKDE